MKVNPIIMDECAICYGNYKSKDVVKHDCNAGIVCINCLVQLSEEQRNKCVVCREDTDIFNKKYLKIENEKRQKVIRENRRSNITINIIERVERVERISYNEEEGRYNDYRDLIVCCCKRINFDCIGFALFGFFLLLIGGWLMDVFFALRLFHSSKNMLQLIGEYVTLGGCFWAFIYATICFCSCISEKDRNHRRINISIV